jgi:protease-4
MLGAATDQLWMQPDSAFQATGFAVEDMFFKRLFEKYGVKAEFEQRREYKNAVNPYLFDNYTAAHKESELSWMTSIYRTAVLTAAVDRKKEPIAFARMFEAGPYSAEDARAKGLIDGVGQVRETSDALLAKVGKTAKLTDFADYMATVRREATTGSVMGGKPAIAVIGAEGPIMTGTSGGGNPFGGEETVWSDDVAEAFYNAIEDKDVKAIVFRVSSPGGSDTASEQILAAVRAAKKAGKPVVVSMGPYAASGGYWISSDASSIVAQPTTLTGSIGVYGGKFAVGPALARFGVDVRELGVGGDYASAFGLGQGFNPQQRAAFAAWMDRTYEGFITRVASGRKLAPERVREIAGGRVWTGAQAKTLGLVDHLGGFPVAVERARTLAKLEANAPLRRMTPSEGALEAFQNALGVSAMSARTLAAAAWVMGDPRAEAILDELTETRLRGQGATVLAPTPW